MMKTLVAVMLCSALAWADPPIESSTVDAPVSADAPLIVLPPRPPPVLPDPVAPDLAGVSVKLKAGDPAPFEGRLLSLTENLARGRESEGCKGELEKAHESFLIPKGALIALVVITAVVAAGAAAGITAVAMKK